ncbi:MAG: AMP-binding protein [Syntrophorhabdaceae bacterium]|nr:AMP-binding protein [Syntrophorhabdaceae bacterium]
MNRERSFLRAVFEKSARAIFKTYFSVVHRIKVEGRENLPRGFDKLIVISNHASLLDGIILWTYIDVDLKILVNRGRARELLLRPFMQNSYTVQIDTLNPYSLKGIIDEVNRGAALLVFPEGRVTRTGNLMKIYEGAGFVAYKTGANILPVHLGNTYETIFAKKRPGRKIFAPITLTIGAMRPSIDLDRFQPHDRKREAARAIYGMLCEMFYQAHYRPSTLGREFIRICKKRGSKPFFKDATGVEVSYRKALVGGLILGEKLSFHEGENTGVLLPNLVATALVIYGLLAFRKVPVLLNYSSGPKALRHAMDLAGCKTIVTSRTFLERVKIDPGLFEGARIVYLEDLKQTIGTGDKVRALTRAFFPGRLARMSREEHGRTAAILFTSGSEGVPKGVCLSHENIIANIWQALSCIDVGANDYFLNALPVFHSFGLTIGVFLPLFAGARSFLYVSPLHYRIVPEIAYEEGCTILVGTNIFLNGYSRRAHPYDFYSMRYVFCGAEALSEAVFERYAKVFGIRVMSGYGATECAPIVCMNSALENKHGSVGKVLPGLEYKVVPVEGIDSKEGHTGRLFVKGRNVMMGYLHNEAANHKYLVEDGGWYDTGDIVEVDDSGFVTIVGRLKRFSKIGGEMISLTAIEEALAGIFGERGELAVMAVADERKGERLVLVTNARDADLKSVRDALREKGHSDLAFPRDIIYMKELPKLGTGKPDYVTIEKIITNDQISITK